MNKKELKQKLEDLYEEAVELYDAFQESPESQLFEYLLFNMHLRDIWEKISAAITELGGIK